MECSLHSKFSLLLFTSWLTPPYQIFELIIGGNYLFDPGSGSRYSKDDDHIAQIIELMGEIPISITFARKYSSEFFNRKGELRYINQLRYWPLDAVLNDNYLFPKEDADAIASFLVLMLRLHPDKRAKAGDLYHHNWVDGVVVKARLMRYGKRRRTRHRGRRKRVKGRRVRVEENAAHN